MDLAFKEQSQLQQEIYSELADTTEAKNALSEELTHARAEAAATQTRLESQVRRARPWSGGAAVPLLLQTICCPHNCRPAFLRRRNVVLATMVCVV